MNKEGIQWRALPKGFCKWQSAYHYFRLWRSDGTWQWMSKSWRGALIVAAAWIAVAVLLSIAVLRVLIR